MANITNCELPAELLYGEIVERVETHTLRINSGGEHSINETGIVSIVFEDGVFKSATFPFSGSYTRNGWRILAAIAEKISEIERRK